MKRLLIFLFVISIILQINAQTNNMNEALLIIDIQNDYFEGGKMPLVGSLEASLNAKLLIEKYRAENKTVIFIQHISTNANASFFAPQTEGVKIYVGIAPKENEKIIVKHYPNSFIETELHDYLMEKEITKLVVCGMMTHMCIDATVRAAKDLDFSVTLISDACATRDLEFEGNKISAANVQYSFLAALNGSYASIMNTKAFLK